MRWFHSWNRNGMPKRVIACWGISRRDEGCLGGVGGRLPGIIKINRQDDLWSLRAISRSAFLGLQSIQARDSGACCVCFLHPYRHRRWLPPKLPCSTLDLTPRASAVFLGWPVADEVIVALPPPPSTPHATPHPHPSFLIFVLFSLFSLFSLLFSPCLCGCYIVLIFLSFVSFLFFCIVYSV